MIRIDIWQALLRGKIHHPRAVMQENSVREDRERLRPLFEDRGEGAFKVLRHAHVQQLQLYSQCLSSGLRLSHGHGVKGIGSVDKHGDVRKNWERPLEEVSRLPSRSGAIELNPLRLPPGRARLGTSPLPAGSPTAIMTTGTNVVTFLTAREAGVPAVTITSTFAARSSATSPENSA